MPQPETRDSLMLRLRDPQDQQAWTQFVSIYEPLILNSFRKRGLQDADARDVAQQVVVAVMQAVNTWQPDGREASFRRWLFAIARKLALRFVQRATPERGPSRRGVGGSDMLEILNQVPDPDPGTIQAFDEDYRDAVFQWAAEKIRCEFREPVWRAFWRTCVLHEPIADVAEELGMTTGHVYVCRSRIIARLRQTIEEFEAEHVTK
jgi:RNA polymerase sigma-70 factor (ECF subfamily)